jgi:hypothetical protein
MTDRPILAALPQGENWDYLADKTGVWLVAPDDELGMSRVITELANDKFSGRSRATDRSHLDEQLSYDARAAEFAAVERLAIERRAGASSPSR